MKIQVFLLVVLSGLASAQVSTQAKGSIAGVVMSEAGAPVRRAAIRLARLPTGPVTSAAQITSMPTYTAESDAEGKFLVDGLEAGPYTLTVQRPGFVSANQGVLLAAGQNMTSIAIKLVPQGLVAGRVTDQDGDPVERAAVTVLRRTYVNGSWQMQQVQAAATGADGTFSIGSLTAGTYYLSSDESPAANALFGRASTDAPQESYVTTYYPNAFSASGAAGFDVKAGAEIRGLEIRLQKARVFRIRGKAVAVGGAVPDSMLTMVPSEGLTSSAGLTRNMAMLRGQDGAFEFNRLLPGTYVLQMQGGLAAMMAAATASPSPAVAMVGRQVITITDQNIDGVVLELGPGSDITGSIRTEAAKQQAGAGANPGPRVRPTITLAAMDGLPMVPPNVQSREDGTFQLKGVGPGPYRMNLVGLPAGMFVKSVRYEGQDATRKPINVRFGAAGALEIVLGADAAILRGTIRDEKGEAVPQVLVSIWEPGAESDGVARFNLTTTTGPLGGFQFLNLPPGEYRVAAWERIEPGIAAAQEFRAQFDAQAATVKLGPGGQQTVDVKLVKREAIEAATAKLR